MRDERGAFDYSSEFGSIYHGARRLSPMAENWIAAVRGEKLRGLIEPGDWVLEYGVGFGWNLMAIDCAEKVGFDVTPELASSVQAKHIRFETSEDRLEEGRYDVVLFHHVMEHLNQPIASLVRLRRFLAKAGRLIIFVPFERERKYWRYNADNKAHHLYSWTPASLQAVAELAGLKVRSVELRKFRFDRIAAVITSRMRGGFGLYRSLRSLGLSLLPEYEIALVAECA